MDKMDRTLLYLEVPIFGNNSHSRVHEIIVDEGKVGDLQDNQDVNFADSGGGIDFNIKELDLSKSFYWRTSGNSLELIERSLNINLHQNHFRIKFENSKVLPNVEIACNNGQIVILFATIHAAHHLKFNIGQNKERSVFHNLSRSNFTESANNYYFSHVESVECFTCGFTIGKGHLGALFAFVTTTGNIVQVKMPYKGATTVTHMNKASRMSRIWSGINPWAGTGAGESPCDIVMVNANDPKLVGVCKDKKLRMWSTKSQECVAQWDVSEYLSDIDQQEQQGHGHKIRTVCNENGRFLSVFYSCGSNLLFLNIKINTDACTYTHISTVQCSPDVISTSLLVDYKLSMQNLLWTLWVDSEDQMVLSVCEINTLVWHDVALNSTLPAIEEINIPQHLSIREVFLEKLFASGSFSSSAITKALSIYQRTSMSNQKIMWKSLRDVVTRAIEEEIHSVLERSEGFTSEELIQIQFSTYQSFYQTCCQYQLKLAKPLGVSVPSDEGVKVVKMDNISHLVAVPNLEAVCRGADPSLFDKILPQGSCFSDLSKLLNTLSLLANILGQDYLDSVVQLICFSENPVEGVTESLDVIGQIIRERSENFELENSYATISDVVSAVKMLMTCLEPDALLEEEGFRQCRSDFLSGDEGLELMVRSLQRYVHDRLQLSLLLLILSMLFDELRDTYPPRISVYVQAYKAIQWAATTELEPSSNSSIESTMRMLSVDESDTDSNSENSVSLLIEYFLRSEGGKLLGSLLSSNTHLFRGELNNSIIPDAVGTIVKILWSLGPTMAFPEFLLSRCQFSKLQHYIGFQLDGWCNFCPGYMMYMSAHCHLYVGNYAKAVHTFIQACGEACNESLFVSRVLKIEEDQYTTNQIEVLYFTKILEYFEKLNLSEHVITLAKYAIGKADNNSVSILCCSIFRQSLVLGRNIEAYNAIVMNPEHAHKKDCLRSMVVTMCERKQYKTLVEHSYEDMHDDLVSILEHRARCSDIMASPHDYYGLLFSFNMHRANYRRAASSMYEQSCRLMVELSGANVLSSLKRQRVCLVSTITCLQLVDKEYQWIVNPITAQGTKSKNLGGKSPKRDLNGDFISDIDKRKVVIVKLSDVKKENLLAETRIKIIEDSKDESMVGPVVNATETITLLNHCGLYKDAFYVSSYFHLSPENIFESLTTKCIKASYTNEEESYLSWLSKNDQSSGLNDNYSSVSDLSWRLLQKFLDEYSDTKKQGSKNYRSVLKTILSYNCQIPAWFLNDYKKLNCPELLRMLYCYDYLDLATSVSIEYVDAVMGCGPEHFNIKATLQSTGASVWLPYNEIERLIILLEDMKNDDKYLQMHKNLSDKMSEYFNELERVNSGMLQYRIL